MNHITQLKDIGKGKKCILIGGGVSVSDINISDYKKYVIIGTNQHLYKEADIIIYYDKDMKDFYETHAVKSWQRLIGFKHKAIDYTCSQCTHYYNYADMVFGDTGFHALQFADKIFNFSQIYLAGYDYYSVDKTYHFDEKESDPDKMDKFLTWSVGNVLEKYYSQLWDNEIINLNKNSSLDLF